MMNAVSPENQGLMIDWKSVKSLILNLNAF